MTTLLLTERAETSLLFDALIDDVAFQLACYTGSSLTECKREIYSALVAYGNWSIQRMTIGMQRIEVAARDVVMPIHNMRIQLEKCTLKNLPDIHHKTNNRFSRRQRFKKNNFF